MAARYTMSIASHTPKVFRPLHALGVLFATSLGGILLGSLISRHLAQYFFGIQSHAWQRLLEASSLPFLAVEQNALLFMLGIQTLTAFLLPAYLTHRYVVRRSAAHYFMPIDRPISTIGLTFGLGLCAIALNSWLIEWNANWYAPTFIKGFDEWNRTQDIRIQNLTYGLIRTNQTSRLFLNLLIFAVLPAIAEECFFRGLLQRVIQSILGHPHLAILISALLFSLMHLQYYSLIPRLMLGILFGYLFFLSGNLSIPILAHFFNNTYAVFSIHFAQDTPITHTPKALPWYALTIAFIVALWLAKRFIILHPIPAK